MRLRVENPNPNPAIISIHDMPDHAIGQMLMISYANGVTINAAPEGPWFRLMSDRELVVYLDDGWDIDARDSMSRPVGLIEDATVRPLMPGESLVIVNDGPLVWIDGTAYLARDVARVNLLASVTLKEIRAAHPEMPNNIRTDQQAVEYLLAISTPEQLLEDCQNDDGEFILRGPAPSGVI